MDDMLFTQVIPRLRVLETRLLDKSKIERMRDAISTEEVIRILGETSYSTSFSGMKKLDGYELVLSEELKGLYKLMYELTPDRKLIDIFSLKYDYHNVKVLLKERYSGKDFKNILIDVGTMPLSKTREYIKDSNYREISQVLRNGIERVEEEYKDNKDSQKIDLILDTYLYKDMLKRAEDISHKFLIQYVKINIDLLNLKTFFRVKKQKKGRDFLKQVLLTGGKIDKDILLDSLNDSVDNLINKLAYTDYYKILKSGLENYSKDESIVEFERLSEDFIMSIMKDAKLISFGPEPLFAYIIAKETEIKLLRIIMVGKLNNIPSSLIGERLRDSYV